MANIACIRCEASPTIGAGHGVRCRVFANALQRNGWKVYFVTSAETYQFLPSLDCFERIEPPTFFDAPFEHSLLVVDHYDLDIKYESHFRKCAKKILVIDDLANRPHDCDILVDQTYGRSKEDYQPHVPKECNVLTGSDYALLRPEFALLRPKALEKRARTMSINRMLINFGGSDPQNYTLEALKLVQASSYKGTIDIVLGFHAQQFTTVNAYAQQMGNDIKIHTNADMAQLIYKADLAIGAAGSSVWERFCLGLPSIMIKIAENQEQNIVSLNHYFNNAKLTLNDQIHNFLSSFQAWKEASQYALKLCDGFGVNRVLNTIKNVGTDRTRLRKASLDDLETTFQWQQQPSTRRFFINPCPPTWEEHKNWFLNQVQHPLSQYYIIVYNSKSCGALLLTYKTEEVVYDLSWYLSEESREKGIGTEALTLATQLVQPFRILASVHPQNLASSRALRRAGFKFVGENKYSSANP